MTSGRRVHRLPDDLVNQIAAGEVVERPASVLKELVENALDAGAATVRVEIEAGGKALVRVADDGHGMGREDAVLALERHATSKLRLLSDLQSLATHGFRGEALPSIASVSHLVLRTRDESGPAGTEIEVRDGRIVHVRDVGHPRGTTVEVRDLFGGVPARRKFLRADATEAGHVAEALTLLALARPETGIVLVSSGRAVIQAPPVSGLRERVYQLFGGRYLEDLVAVEDGADWARVRGFVGRPDRAAARPSLRLFVNGRAVRDRGLAKAVAEGFRAAGAREARGEALLFLETPTHLVDVNVHPAKAEVRFADPRTPWAAIERAVRESLSRGGRAQAPGADTARVTAAVEAFREGASRVAEARALWPAQRSSAAVAPEPVPATAPAAGAPDAAAGLGMATVLGQHRRTYIVATDGEELLLVDQHTAHERVRFERITAQLAAGAVESQLLLVPLVFTPSPAVRPLLEAGAAELAALGYEVEGFGGGAVRIGAVPAVLAATDPAQALEAVLRDLLEREGSQWLVASLRERLAATLACHSAVRAGQPLPPDAMAAIVRDLAGTSHPTLCPHGRPTIVRIPRAELTRWFGRGGWSRQ
ncbi:MAG TPA: DNA mismatch repair endonuclease MutL [Vicinamibacteria bacterium]